VLSSFDCSFNLRRYTKGDLKNDDRYFSAVLRCSSGGLRLWTHYDAMDNALVGRCRLTVSTSVLKVPMVSALESKM